MLEQSYNLIVPTKVGNRRAPETGGYGTHWREGGSKRTNLLKGNITRRGARNDMFTDTRWRSPMSHGGLKRAQSWKQRIQPKEAYSSPGLLYSEGPAGSRGW